MPVSHRAESRVSRFFSDSPTSFTICVSSLPDIVHPGNPFQPLPAMHFLFQVSTAGWHHLRKPPGQIESARHRVNPASPKESVLLRSDTAQLCLPRNSIRFALVWIVFCAFLFATAKAVKASTYDGPAELPRVFVQTLLAQTPSPGKPWFVPAGQTLVIALGSDGKDLGADIAAIQAATSKCSSTH